MSNLALPTILALSAFVAGCTTAESTATLSPSPAPSQGASAAAGQILISDNAYVPDLMPQRLEQRQLALKGNSRPVTVYVLKEYS